MRSDPFPLRRHFSLAVPLLAVQTFLVAAQAQVVWQPSPQDEPAWEHGESAGAAARDQIDDLVVLIYDEGTGFFFSVGGLVAGELQLAFEDLKEVDSLREWQERRLQRAKNVGGDAVAYVLDATRGELEPVENWLVENDDTVREFRRGGARFVDLVGTTGYLVYDTSTDSFRTLAQYYSDNRQSIEDTARRTGEVIYDAVHASTDSARDVVREHHDALEALGDGVDASLAQAAVTVVATMEFVRDYYVENETEIVGTTLNTLEGLAEVATGTAHAVREYVRDHPEIERQVRDAVETGVAVGGRLAQRALAETTGTVTRAIQSDEFGAVVQATERSARAAASHVAGQAGRAFSSAGSAVGGFVSGFFGR